MYKCNCRRSSDQYYLSAIKNLLIGRGIILPNHEIVFIPAGGVKGIAAVVSIITGKDQQLPFVLLDGDTQGTSTARKLRDGVYESSPERVLVVSELIDMVSAEIEDLIPNELLANIINRMLPRPTDLEDDFLDIVDNEKPIVDQIEVYAISNGIELKKGWKVELAQRTKTYLLRGKNLSSFNELTLNKWEEIFKLILN